MSDPNEPHEPHIIHRFDVSIAIPMRDSGKAEEMMLGAMRTTFTDFGIRHTSLGIPFRPEDYTAGAGVFTDPVPTATLPANPSTR